MKKRIKITIDQNVIFEGDVERFGFTFEDDKLKLHAELDADKAKEDEAGTPIYIGPY